MALQFEFHPEDLLAMGLALGGIASVIGGRWIRAGLLLGLSLLAQPFVLLVIAPLLVLVPAKQRVPFIGAMAGAIAVVVVPLTPVTSGRAITTFAADENNTLSTWVTETHLHGAPLFVLSRLLPILLGLLLALWARQRFGQGALAPLPLTAVIAASLAFRLLFEVSLYGYYFLAVAVMLLLSSVLSGRRGVYFAGWCALTILAFTPLRSGHDPLMHAIPLWLWQIVLVGGAFALAALPLLSAPVEAAEPTSMHHGDSLDGAPVSGLGHVQDR